jgi:hypothetical protein
MVYLARLFERRINRTLTPAMITIGNQVLVLMERDGSSQSTETPSADTKAMMEFLEDPDSYIRLPRGRQGPVPLSLSYSR